MIRRIVALPAPSQREQSQWYFQRYVPHLPAGGEIVLFDRSWYNRAGVEEVMGFCTPEQVSQFYEEANVLEPVFMNAGIHLTKFFFNITKEEQAKRFRSRQTSPLKVGKMSAVDLASQDK